MTEDFQDQRAASRLRSGPSQPPSQCGLGLDSWIWSWQQEQRKFQAGKSGFSYGRRMQPRRASVYGRTALLLALPSGQDSSVGRSLSRGPRARALVVVTKLTKPSVQPSPASARLRRLPRSTTVRPKRRSLKGETERRRSESTGKQAVPAEGACRTRQLAESEAFFSDSNQHRIIRVKIRIISGWNSLLLLVPPIS